ncbi:MAG: hypothetical protein ABL921_34325, partial [Pirellula sp.]
LKDAASFVKDLRDRVVNNFDQAGSLTTEVLRQKIYEAVGPGGLNWLQDRNGNGVQIDDVVLSPGIINSATSEIRVDMTLAQSATLVDLPLDFDLGLPLIGLELDGGIQIKAGFNWNFGFGISKTQGFFLSTAVNDELKFTIDATIPNFAAKGSLGFFQVDATDDPTAPSHLTGQIVVNLLDPSNDGRLTLGELTSLNSFTQIVDARFTGNADINLKLRASLGGSADFPNINADFNLDWNFLNSSTIASSFGGNSSPVLALNNVTIDAGQAISKFLGPILSTIDDILQPIEPILDFLNAPLPVVTDLLGSPVSLLTLAEVYSTVGNNEGLANAAKFIKLATQINDLANTASQTGSAAINLGSFKIAGGAGAIAGLDLRNTSLASLDETRISQIAGVLGNVPLLGDVLKFVNATEILAGAAGGLSGNQGGFDFPIIKKPLSVIQALLGGKPEGIVFFTFQTPNLSLDALLDLQIPIFPPFLTAFLSGGISADMQFGFGFDASGMAKFVDSGEPADIFDGFYISDRKNPDGTGPDIAEVVVNGAIEVGAFAGIRAGAVDISAGAQGGIYATVEANLNDPNNSGRIHPSELAVVIDQGFECLVDLQGSVKAAASISVTVEALGLTVFKDSYEFASATLLEFKHHCETPVDGPGLASISGGVLTLLFDQAGDDNFRVVGGADGSLTVKARGKQQIFQGVTS